MTYAPFSYVQAYAVDRGALMHYRVEIDTALHTAAVVPPADLIDGTARFWLLVFPLVPRVSSVDAI